MNAFYLAEKLSVPLGTGLFVCQCSWLRPGQVTLAGPSERFSLGRLWFDGRVPHDARKTGAPGRNGLAAKEADGVETR